MGVVGNCAFMAYTDVHAHVRWMCMPRFDSSFLFGSLLDKHKGGEFSVTPENQLGESRQYYLENTNILCTEFDTNQGSLRVIDFAPRFYQNDRIYRPLMLIRKVELLSGAPMLKICCSPVGDYGRVKPERMQGSNHIRFEGLGEPVRLTTNLPLSYITEDKSFILTETGYLLFTYGIPLEGPLESTCEDFLTKTTQYWRRWVKGMVVPAFYQEFVIRSALALKMHQYEDTGGIIASGTMALPEYHMSTRNWDYRYCWMRDAYYTLNAFNSIGHFDELEHYFRYIQNVMMHEQGNAQPLYTILGDKRIVELELDLEGYMGNKPVRVGNDAYTHIQNDVYGQVLTSLLPLYVDKRLNSVGTEKHLGLVRWLLSKIEMTMEMPDAGIWEFRERAQLHCYTFLFHWAGSNAAAKIAGFFGDESLKTKALLLATRASEQIEACYDNQRKVYTQAVGVPYLDAACLLLITMRYLDPATQRAKDHLSALEKELLAESGLFYRYIHTDDFGKPESTFLVCAFWYIEALAAVGRLPEAATCFENLMKYSNHLGLFSEDVHAETGSQWGNFPQTYSHVGLMNAAFRIDKKLDLPNFL